MKKSCLLLFFVLLLICPLSAQEKTNDPVFDEAIFDDPGFDLGQVASGPMNYQRYGPNDCGSEAEGYWESHPEGVSLGKVATPGYAGKSDSD